MPAPKKAALEPRLSMDAVKAKLEKLKHPRVTEDTMKAQIASVAYCVPENSPHTMICSIVTSNGFVFIGTSTPAAPENFNAEIGQRYAYENAFRQIWTHEGYLLKFVLGLAQMPAEPSIAGLLSRFHVPTKPKAARARGKS